MEINHLASTEQEIHAIVKVSNSNFSWLLSTIYASPRFHERSIVWSNLANVAANHELPWVMMGDFNEVLMSSKKFGGRPVNIRRAMKFQDCLDLCGMMDMGYSGARNTWSNLREVTELIQERLDRSFCSWRQMFPEASVKHMTRINSDHCPLLVELNPSNSLNFPRPFRFQLGWLAHPDFTNVVRKAWTNAESLNVAVNEFTISARKME